MVTLHALFGILGRAVVLLVRRRLWRVQIEGMSMSPTLRSGEIVWCEVGVRTRDLNRGDVVLLRSTPSREALVQPVASEDMYDIKRLVALPGDDAMSFGCGNDVVPAGHCLVLSDNPSQGIDSRTYGPIPLRVIAGRAIVWGGSKLRRG